MYVVIGRLFDLRRRVFMLSLSHRDETHVAERLTRCTVRPSVNNSIGDITSASWRIVGSTVGSRLRIAKSQIFVICFLFVFLFTKI